VVPDDYRGRAAEARATAGLLHVKEAETEEEESQHRLEET